MVGAQTTYTVAALGPDPGLRVEILQNQIATHAGKALVRVVQASLKENRVTVSYGPTILARQLNFGSATPYVAVSPGEQAIQLSAPGEHTTVPVTLSRVASPLGKTSAASTDLGPVQARSRRPVPLA
jgi:hypothetical protein